MIPLDDIDRRMIALLRQDARASVTTLAGALGIARGTAQARLTRLTREGVIRRFTVDLADPAAPDMMQATTLIQVAGTATRQVHRALSRMPQVSALYSTNGAWDMVAMLELGTLAEFDQVLARIRDLPGIANSESCLLLRRLD